MIDFSSVDWGSIANFAVIAQDIEEIKVPDVNDNTIEDFVNGALKQLAVIAVLLGAVTSIGAVRRKQQNELFHTIWIVSLYATFCVGGLALITGLISFGLSFLNG